MVGPEPSCKVFEQDGCCHHRLKPARAHVSSFKEAEGCGSLHGWLPVSGCCRKQRGAIQQTNHCSYFRDHLQAVRHAKRSTVTTEDVKLLARRSNSLLKYITQKSDELTSSNMEQKEKKKKKSSAAKGGRTSGEQVTVTESEDSNMA
ncbi:centromere protein S isoform 2-T2 [Morphnus guianensis]